MCERDADQPLRHLFAPAAKPATKRRRLWELTANTHCPVIGLCVPLCVLRRLVNKGVRGTAVGDDYEIHIGAVSECASRNRISELLQDALDQRYCAELHRFKKAADADTVKALWLEAVSAGDVAGAFWATLTHPRCDYALQDLILGQVHMIQHQAGAAKRVDLARHHALQVDNALLTQALDKQARALADKARELDQAVLQASALRAELVARDQALAQLEARLAALPELEARTRLQQRLDEAMQRERARNQQIAALRQALAEPRLLNEAPGESAAPPEPPAVPEPVRLDDKTVLCVGGRSGKIHSYRDLIEQAGGRFAHHDGGQEDAAELLDASLAAADLVICQTGCISHSAYWRVKDHCKRRGKQCVFIDNPSSASFSRGLRQIKLVTA